MKFYLLMYECGVSSLTQALLHQLIISIIFFHDGFVHLRLRFIPGYLTVSVAVVNGIFFLSKSTFQLMIISICEYY